MAASGNKKNQPSLSNSLTKYIQKHVIPGKNELRKVQDALVMRIVTPILHKVGELDDRFVSNASGFAQEAGAGLVGVGLSERRRVDVIVPLLNLLSSKCVSAKSGEELPLFGKSPASFLDSVGCDNPYISKLNGFGYVLADTSKCLVHDLLSIKQDEVSSLQREDLTFANKSFVSPGKVVKVFFALVEESVEILLQECFWEEEPTIYEITVKREGHSVRIHVILSGDEYTIDLIPALSFTGGWPKSLQEWGPKCAARPNQWLDYARMSKVKNNFFVYGARPPPGHDAFRLWCTNFSLSEKILVESVLDDDADGTSCRASALLAVLSLCEENPQEFYPVTPRIVKTAFLHQCTQYPLQDDWASHKLGRAFVDLFMAIVGMLKSGACHHYFLPSVNILDDSEDLRPIAHHLKAILSDIVENPHTTQFLHNKPVH